MTKKMFVFRLSWFYKYFHLFSMSKQKILFSFLAIFAILVLAVFYFFENFSFLISGNFSSENGKCQNNSVENVQIKIEKNQDKITEIKQKLELQYPKLANIKNSNANKNYESNVLLPDQVFWSIEKSTKCPENNLVRFDIATDAQKEIVKLVLRQNSTLEYEIWNR